jgi:hypothetical protein
LRKKEEVVMSKLDRRIPSGKFCSGDRFSDGCDFLLEDDGKGYCCLLQKRLEECDINEESCPCHLYSCKRVVAGLGSQPPV